MNYNQLLQISKRKKYSETVLKQICNRNNTRSLLAVMNNERYSYDLLFMSVQTWKNARKVAGNINSPLKDGDITFRIVDS